MRLNLTDETLSGQLQNLAALAEMRAAAKPSAWDIVERHQIVGRLSTETLVAIACGHVDVRTLAHEELVARGAGV